MSKPETDVEWNINSPEWSAQDLGVTADSAVVVDKANEQISVLLCAADGALVPLGDGADVAWNTINQATASVVLHRTEKDACFRVFDSVSSKD